MILNCTVLIYNFIRSFFVVWLKHLSSQAISMPSKNKGPSYVHVIGESVFTVLSKFTVVGCKNDKLQAYDI